MTFVHMPALPLNLVHYMLQVVHFNDNALRQISLADVYMYMYMYGC